MWCVWLWLDGKTKIIIIIFSATDKKNEKQEQGLWHSNCPYS